MSHSRRLAGRRSSGRKVRGRQVVRKQSVMGSRKRSAGTALSPFATSVGLGIAMILLIGLAFMVVIGHGSSTVDASGGGPPGVSAGYGSLNHPKGPCGNDGQSPCAAVDPGWFPVTPGSPGAVAGAIASSRDFAAMANQYGCASLDTPALVHAYGAHTGMDYYDDDHWVVSARDTSGMRCGLFDFVYDSTHQRLRFSSYGILTAQDPHSRQAFPYVSSSVALAQLQSQRGLRILTGTQPELIFFPIDPSFPYLNSPVHKWAGGGNSAMNPMWHIVGSDGSDYFLGANLGVYARQDLPIARGQP
jgi:hypothetical protein